ncbi:MAG: DUF2834 domain-containing protein [Bacteriovoracaceae bacterium]|nr:DUF2834 domain-containing protein [Bacteriovoracaceae bacterium]
MEKISKTQWAYLILAVIGLLVTWTQNVFYLSPETGGLVQFVKDTMVNHASRSITLDIVVLFLVCALWMVIESKKIGMKRVWIYIAGGLFVAISVSFPLFLFFREKKLKDLAL